MRNIWAFILCISISGPFASGYLLVHIFQLMHARHVQNQMESGLLDKELITLHFSTSEFASLEWEHENEFKWLGRMYDVKSISVTPHGTDILCWQDEQESRLDALKNQSRDTRLADGPSQEQKETQIPAFKVQLNIPESGVSFCPQPVSCTSVPAYRGSMLLPVSQKPPTPPPDLAI